jgi:hypothetical protein
LRTRLLPLIGLLGGLVLLLASVGGCTSAPDPVHQKQVATTALQRDFPGFLVTRLTYYRRSPRLAEVVATYQENAQFTLRCSVNRKLAIEGDYDFSSRSGDPNASLRGTIFDGRRLTSLQVQGFASAWTTLHPGLALQADDPTYVLSGAADGVALKTALYQAGALEYDSALSRNWEARNSMRLGDVFAFPTAKGVFWLHINRATGEWTELGHDDWLVRALGYKPV